MRLLDYFGTAVFAASGAATAGEAGLDSFGSTFVGAVTALGGGTTRDLLLGRQAFWLAEGEYVIIAVASGALSFFCWPFWGFSGDSFGLFAADSLSLGTFCTIGAMNGCNAAVSPHIAALCGMATATFGGAARDLLTRKPVRILHNYAEIYATPALSGAASFLTLRALNAPPALSFAAGILTTFVFRTWAWTKGIRLPYYRGLSSTTKT